MNWKNNIPCFAAGIIALSACYNTALANDTVAAGTSAGLEFKKSNEVSMESEELYISREKIRVKYLFINTSDHDVEDTVAFPITGAAGPENEGEEPQGNDFDFQLMVNGQKKQAQFENKNGYKFYWQQIFPKGKPVIIEHEYKAGSGDADGAEPRGVEWKIFKEKYCVDKTLENSINRRLQAVKDDDIWPWHSAGEVNYILKTGANWKDGKIKHFKMTLDKGDYKNVVSLCWSAGNVKKLNATQFTFEQDNFVPAQDLKILFIDVPFLNTSDIERLRKKSILGDAKSQYDLGTAYQEGNGVEQNYTEAEKWLRKSAMQGNSDAQSSMGWLYHDGNGVPVDKVLAYMWFYLAGTPKGFDESYWLSLQMGSGMHALSITKEQIEEAKKKAHALEWINKNRSGLN